ncbi:pyridoxal phosphate-dependent aminotransferase [Halobaculum sp. D14]|uniref:pyridoxal phosphate-dependent aminotransferase n=1 Tax=Halobaculum sp. D14 TaxID=3421642 RepID=UPI003EB9489A
MFPPLAYLEWIDGRPAAADYDLGTSDLRLAETPDGAEPVPPRLAGLDAPAGDASLAALVADEYGVAEDRVVVTAGATHANFVAAATAYTLDDGCAAAADAEVGGADTGTDDSAGGARTGRDAGGDEDESGPRALVEAPGYEPLVELPRALGARVERFRRPAPEAELLPDRVENAVVAAGSEEIAHVTVTNRHNPTGRLESRDDLADVAGVVADHEGYLLVDEVYAPYTAEPVDGRGFGGPTAAGLPSTVVTGSLTKFHGLGGLKIGWLVAPPEFAECARAVEAHVPAVAEPSVALAKRLFANRDDLVAESRKRCVSNHGLLAEFVAGRDDLTGPVPDGSPFGLLRHDTADGDEVARAAWDAGVLVVPGRFFGAPDGARVSLGGDAAESERALAAFGAVLDGL